MSPEARASADAYLNAAQSWAQTRDDDIRASRRLAWIVALVATAVAALLAIAVLAMLPLKTVVPYTLLVDRQTGYVQALDPLDANRIAPDSALTQSFLVQYVLAREGFDWTTVQQDYRKVLLWSADTAERDYAARMPATNSESPLNRVARGGGVEARVRSVSSLGGRTALVRFETARRDRGGTTLPPQSWVAVIDYRFTSTALSAEDRFLNPLGFEVTRYRRNAETPPAPESVVVAPSVGTGSSPSNGAAPAVAPRPAGTRQ
jgi:type IV secretion system protein VirB8